MAKLISSLAIAALLVGCSAGSNPADGLEDFQLVEHHTEVLSQTQGRWSQEGGVLQCDGVLTRSARDEFCSASIPEDWQPFAFNGEVYFAVPVFDAQGPDAATSRCAVGVCPDERGSAPVE